MHQSVASAHLAFFGLYLLQTCTGSFPAAVIAVKDSEMLQLTFVK